MPNARSIPPPPKSPNKLSGGTGFSPGRPMACQGAGQSDVIEIMAGDLCKRSVLAPAGNPAINETWVFFQTFRGTQSKSFHHARSRALDQPVGSPPPSEEQGPPHRACLRSQDNATPPAKHGVSVDLWINVRTINANDLGTHIRQHHRAKRARP